MKVCVTGEICCATKARYVTLFWPLTRDAPKSDCKRVKRDNKQIFQLVCSLWSRLDKSAIFPELTVTKTFFFLSDSGMKARPPSTTLSWFKSNRPHLLAFCATMVTPLTGFRETCFSAPPTPRDTSRVLQYPVWICACGNIAKTVCLVELKLVMRLKYVLTAVDFSSFRCYFGVAGMWT